MRSALSRVLARVIRDGDCLVFQGATDRYGYGSVRNGPRTVGAHVIVAEAAYGPRPTEQHEVLHSCDNPPCVERTNLRWGTRKDNVSDMVLRNRLRGDFASSPRVGEQNPTSKITEADVTVIRERAAYGESSRCISIDYPVTPSNIRKIVSGKTWTPRPTDTAGAFA